MRRAAALCALGALWACAHPAPRPDAQAGAEGAQDELARAIAEHGQGHIQAAAERLARVSARGELPARLRADALVQEGVCRAELGALDAAEERLARGQQLLAGAPDPELSAQAAYWRGEVERARMTAIRLEPQSMDDASLRAALEQKAGRLRAAQEHYVAALRQEDSRWSAAAGTRIAGLYEAFHRELVEAPAPPGLEPRQRELYHRELRGRARKLLESAAELYDATLQAARRAGVQNAFVEQAQAALERVHAVLAASEPL